MSGHQPRRWALAAHGGTLGFAAWRCLPDPLFIDGFDTGTAAAWTVTVP